MLELTLVVNGFKILGIVDLPIRGKFGMLIGAVICVFWWAIGEDVENACEAFIGISDIDLCGNSIGFLFNGMFWDTSDCLGRSIDIR